MWSWNDQDPPVNGVPARHTMQGSAVANLLGGLTNPPQNPPDAQTFKIGVNNVRYNNIEFHITPKYPASACQALLTACTCSDTALLLIMYSGAYRWHTQHCDSYKGMTTYLPHKIIISVINKLWL